MQIIDISLSTKRRPGTLGERRAEYIRSTYPYGKWATKDGTQVLFNRHYQPIWKKRPDGVVVEAKKDWWVPEIVTQEHYYDESCPPYGNYNLAKTRKTRERCNKVLDEFLF